MDPVAEPSSGIRDALQSAAIAAECASPTDIRTLVELLGHLKALEGHLQLASRRDDAKLCSFVALMTEHLIERQQPSLETLVDWVNGIVQYLGMSLGVTLADDWAKLRPPREKTFVVSEAKMARRELGPDDGHRLGEILVQMSFLKASDVERASRSSARRTAGSGKPWCCSA